MSVLERIQVRSRELYVGSVPATKLAEEFDTPLYVMDEDRVRQNYRRLSKALTRRYGRVSIYYAAKANSNISVLKILRSEGSNVDTVSVGEIFLSLKAGFSPHQILFTGTSVRDDELRYALNKKVTVNIDSLSQLRRLLKIEVPETLSVRVNPEVGAGHHEHCITAGRESKFGLWASDALKAYKTAKKAGVKRFGIHMHIGSGILTSRPFILALQNLLNVAKAAHEEIGVDFDFIDIGGGLGVPYRPEERSLNLDDFSEKVLGLFTRKVEEYGLGKPAFYVEPGRYIVCDATVLLTRVNTVKRTPFKTYVGVDAGFNVLVRPAMYGSYHHIVVADKMGLKDEMTYDVAGPLCESGDLLARDRRLPKVEEGDLLAVMNAGAYGYAMSSQYNSRPRPAEVLVCGGKFSLVRKREGLNHLLSNQRIAEWLK